MTQIAEKQRPLKLLIKDDEVQKKFAEMLGGKGATAFLMSVLNCVQNNDKLSVAEPQSVLMASAVAATLNLPIDPNLGMAYIVPYKNNQTGVTVAQFQMGYKGFVALCHRTGQFHRINVEPVYEGELGYIDRLSGDITFNWHQDNDARNQMKLIGMVAYFRLNNGFEKTFYMSDTELEAHGKKYSQTYKRGFGLWKDDPIGMKKKTTLKLLLEKFAPKSVELQKAIKTDQGVLNDYDGNEISYLDNEKEPLDLDKLNAETERRTIVDFIKNCTSIEQLEECYTSVPDEEVGLLYLSKKEELEKLEKQQS